MKKAKEITRKDFMKGMGVSLAGITVAGSVGGLLTACSDTDTGGATAAVDAGSTPNPPEWPYKYEKIDPDKVRARAFDAYKTKGGWGIGVSEGFFGELAEVVGYPFDHLPPEAYINAAGGYGQAILCGSLGVAAACIGTVTDADTQKAMVGELLNWYKDFPFPEYQPEGLDLPTTVAGSALCADSVGNFMELTGLTMADDDRKSRCAGVAADIAGKITEMLNEHYKL